MKLIRNASAVIGALLFFGAAGADEMYVEMGKIPPNSVTAFLIAAVSS